MSPDDLETLEWAVRELEERARVPPTGRSLVETLNDLRRIVDALKQADLDAYLQETRR